jgi:hypothetical protein
LTLWQLTTGAIIGRPYILLVIHEKLERAKEKQVDHEAAAAAMIELMGGGRQAPAGA